MKHLRLESSAIALALVVVPGAASAAPTNSSLTNLTVSQAFPAWQSTIKYALRNSGGAEGFGNLARATSSFRYDAATNSYIIRDTGSTAITSTFSPGNKVAGESDATFTVYRKTNGGTTETLRLLNPGASNPLIALTYTSYGNWRRTTPGATSTAVNDTYIVYGIKTTAANMPRTGAATYSAVLDGTFVNKSGSYALSGTGAFVADFAAGKISYTANPVGTPASGPLLNFGTVGGSGSISFNGASFTGKADTSNPTYRMNASGYFFGPSANEIGANFGLSGGGGNGHGVMVGKKD